MKRIILIGLAVLTALSTGSSVLAQQSREYRLAPQDTIKVDVFNEADLSNQELRVSAKGEISFPLLNSVQVAGKTLGEVELLLEELLNKDYLVEPQVTVSVKTYKVRSVNVMGAVTKAGAVELPAEERLTIIDAIARAGGFTKIANEKRIEVTKNGVTKTYSMDDLAKATDPRQIVYVEEGDIINVDERRF